MRWGLPSPVLDDVEGHVAAARAAGWHGVVHEETETSIDDLEPIIRIVT